MADPYVMNGIIGYRPHLSYSAINERCSVRIEGHDEVIAHLPFETVDAVFTSRGLLVHRNTRNELQAVFIPDHENLWKIACGSAQDTGQDTIEEKAIATCKKVIGSIEPGSVKLGNAKAQDARTFEQIRMIVRHMMTDLVKKEVIPLTTRIEELRRQNQRLADKIQALEDQNGQVSQNTASVQEFKPDAAERQWGERGGLPTFLHQQDNPFCKQRR